MSKNFNRDFNDFQSVKSLCNCYIIPAFPNTCISTSNERDSIINDIHSITGRVRYLRNRICHHEPIFDENKIDLISVFNEIKQVLCYISPKTTEILGQLERISQTILRKTPKGKRHKGNPLRDLRVTFPRGKVLPEKAKGLNGLFLRYLYFLWDI